MPQSLHSVKRVRKTKRGFPGDAQSRAIIANEVRLGRNYHPKYWPETRDFTNYAKTFGSHQVHLADTLRQRIRAQGSISVLDVGMGQGIFLKDLKRMFGEKITTVGISLKRPASIEGIDALRIQLAERPSYRKSFDFIFSYYMLPYSTSRNDVIKNICRALKVGGTAYIIPALGLNYEELQKNGLIKIMRSDPSNDVIIFTRLR